MPPPVNLENGPMVLDYDGSSAARQAVTAVAAIVVGSRGLSGRRARLEGCTSKDVVKRAPCPVVVVHDATDSD